MANLKSLAKDTLIYGMSSIIGRFINYFLVPIYAYRMPASSGEYGIITNIYAYTALLLVILTFGMETTFFRYANKVEEKPMVVYSTTLIAVGSVCMAFVALLLGFLTPLSSVMGYADHPEYLAVMGICVALDAFQSIPFAFLRYKSRPIKFAFLKLLFIAMNISLNIIYFFIIPLLYTGPDSWVAPLLGKNGTFDVGVVFYINLICTTSITLFFYKELTGFKWTFERTLIKKMLVYAWPILVLGIAGILNLTADKIIYPILRPGLEGKQELAVYGACIKIATIMAMIMQAFRYAYEPFVFGKSTSKDNRDTYAKAMKYFIIFTLLAFLIVMGNMEILQHIVGKDYREGLRVVPIVMAAEILMGITFNLSFWYKLTDRTIWGAIFSGIGCFTLIIVNVAFIPHYHYMACAWGGVAGYGVTTVLSYWVGQKYYPIHYPLKSIGVYVLLAGFFFAIMTFEPLAWHKGIKLLINELLILAFIGHILYHDFPIRQIPIIGKYFK